MGAVRKIKLRTGVVKRMRYRKQLVKRLAAQMSDFVCHPVGAPGRDGKIAALNRTVKIVHEKFGTLRGQLVCAAIQRRALK